MENEERVRIIIETLEKEHPDAKITLNYSNPLELLVATMLSAQSTDKTVNKVTGKLFEKYPDADAYAKADLKKLEKDLKPTGFYRNKAKHLKKACQMLLERYNSKVPNSMCKLTIMPGVARKTANVVLTNAFGVIEGITVDTHVRRLSRRLELSKNEDPNKIERDLMEILPKEKWATLADLFIFHGRRVCKAKKPNCKGCAINTLCPSSFTF